MLFVCTRMVVEHGCLRCVRRPSPLVTCCHCLSLTLRCEAATSGNAHLPSLWLLPHPYSPFYTTLPPLVVARSSAVVWLVRVDSCIVLFCSCSCCRNEESIKIQMIPFELSKLALRQRDRQPTPTLVFGVIAPLRRVNSGPTRFRRDEAVGCGIRRGRDGRSSTYGRTHAGATPRAAHAAIGTEFGYLPPQIFSIRLLHLDTITGKHCCRSPFPAAVPGPSRCLKQISSPSTASLPSPAFR
jgi:hypothetical protein